MEGKIEIDYLPINTNQSGFYYVENDTIHWSDDNLTWRESMDENNWSDYLLLTRLVNIFVESNELEQENEDEINGVECYVYYLSQKTDYGEYFRSADLIAKPEPYYYISKDEKDYSLITKYWIEKDTNLPEKIYLKATWRLTNASLSALGEPAEISHETEILFCDYDN